MRNNYKGVYRDPNGNFRITTSIKLDKGIYSTITVRGYQTAIEANSDLAQLRLMLNGQPFFGFSTRLLNAVNNARKKRNLEPYTLTASDSKVSPRAQNIANMRDSIYDVDQLVSDFEKLMTETAWKATTAKVNMNAMKVILECFKGCSLHDMFTENACQNFRMKILERDNSVERKNIYLALFKRFAEYLFSIKAIIDQVEYSHARAATMKLKGVSKDVIESKASKGQYVLTNDQIRAFLDTFDKENAKDFMYYVFFLILVSRAPRISELIGLYVHNIDFERGVMTIDHQYAKGINMDTTTKNNKTRKVPLSPQIIDAIKKHIDNMKLAPSDRLFCGKKALSHTIFQYKLKNHCRLAGIPDTWAHAFRSKIASDIMNDSQSTMTDQAFIASILGHDLNTDLTSYAKVKESQNVKDTILKKFEY